MQSKALATGQCEPKDLAEASAEYQLCGPGDLRCMVGRHFIKKSSELGDRLSFASLRRRARWRSSGKVIVKKCVKHRNVFCALDQCGSQSVLECASLSKVHTAYGFRRVEQFCLGDLDPGLAQEAYELGQRSFHNLAILGRSLSGTLAPRGNGPLVDYPSACLSSGIFSLA